MPTSMRRVAIAATVGTVIEWYDFFLYGTAAALVFNKLFFPVADPITGTLLSLAAYATGFVARPFGGVLAGHLGDRLGRKATLLFTLVGMGLATSLIGLLPTYQAIGAGAPVLLVLLRILQGVATGGEWGGAALLTVEHARSRRGFWGSFLTVGILLGLVLGTLAFSLFNGLPAAAFLAWGWRIPFLLSIVLVGLGLYIRTQVAETPEFTEVKQRNEHARLPLLAALREPRNVLAILGMRMAENSSFYVYSVFVLAYVTQFLHLPRSLVLAAVMVGALVECVSSVLFGILCDRVGGKVIMQAGIIFQILFAFPFFWLLDTRAPAAIFLSVTAGLALGNGAISSVQPEFFARFFGTRARYSGISLGREAGTVIGGGVVPLVATALLASLHANWPIAAIMAGLGVIGLLALATATMHPVTESDRSPSAAEAGR
jgi:MFS transporter, MHS family, shikimate and dehydroshikimate transport protein